MESFRLIRVQVNVVLADRDIMTLIGHGFTLTHVTVRYPCCTPSLMALSGTLRALLCWDRVFATIWLISDALVLCIVVHTNCF